MLLINTSQYVLHTQSFKDISGQVRLGQPVRGYLYCTFYIQLSILWKRLRDF